MNPSGIRFGTPPLTTRNIKPQHIDQVGEYIHQAWTIALEVQAKSGPKLVDWKRELEGNAEIQGKISDLKACVEAFASQFPLPGYDDI